MTQFLSSLFSTDFMPHGYCLRLPDIIWLHEISDLTIALSYFLIPLALVYLMRIRRDLAYPWMFGLFGLFILSCGTTHILAVWVLWHPMYRFEGVVKAFTALVSFPTALLLFRLVPQVRLLPSAEQLRRQNEQLAREISERKLAEDEVRRLNAELEHRVEERTIDLRQANEDLRHFTWAASHDLQEPLRMVTLFSELVEKTEADNLSEKGQFYLHTAADGARKMKLLIKDLLSYTQISNAPPTKGSESASAEDALDEARRNLGVTLAELQTEVIVSSPLPVVGMVRSQLVQIFQNLISNAIRYRTPDVPLKIQIDAEQKESVWLFSVADNGIGIDPQHHKRVFEAFRRLGGQEIAGSGLGLTLCQRMVERAGGRIWVESEGEGHGSVFRFTLPIK
jgi:signal transduction histidine kinase